MSETTVTEAETVQRTRTVRICDGCGIDEDDAAGEMTELVADAGVEHENHGADGLDRAITFKRPGETRKRRIYTTIVGDVYHLCAGCMEVMT